MEALKNSQFQKLINSNPEIKNVMQDAGNIQKAQDLLKNPEVAQSISHMITNPETLQKAGAMLEGLKQVQGQMGGRRKSRKNKRKSKRNKRMARKSRRRSRKRRGGQPCGAYNYHRGTDREAMAPCSAVPKEVKMECPMGTFNGDCQLRTAARGQQPSRLIYAQADGGQLWYDFIYEKYENALSSNKPKDAKKYADWLKKFVDAMITSGHRGLKPIPSDAEMKEKGSDRDWGWWNNDFSFNYHKEGTEKSYQTKYEEMLKSTGLAGGRRRRKSRRSRRRKSRRKSKKRKSRRRKRRN